MNWFNAALALIVAALFEFAIPVMGVLLLAMVVVWAVQVWWRRRQARRHAQAVVKAAIREAWQQVADDQARAAFLDRCETVRLTGVIPGQRRGEP